MMKAYRTNYRIISFVVKNIINYVILANTILSIVKNIVIFVNIAKQLAIM